MFFVFSSCFPFCFLWICEFLCWFYVFFLKLFFGGFMFLMIKYVQQIYSTLTLCIHTLVIIFLPFYPAFSCRLILCFLEEIYGKIMRYIFIWNEGNEMRGMRERKFEERMLLMEILSKFSFMSYYLKLKDWKESLPLKEVLREFKLQ